MNLSPRRIAAGALCAVAVLGTPALAHDRHPGRPHLAGRTVVTATSASGVLVEVPETVEVSGRWAKNPHISVRGGGEFVGFTLSDADDTSNVFSVIRLPKSVGSTLMVGSTQRSFDGAPVIRRGTYWLSIAPGGKPATVTLSLPGLGGQRRITPTAPIRSRVETLTPTATAQGGGVTHGAGRDVTLDSEGLLVTLLTFNRAGASAADQLGACWYEGATTNIPAAARFSPLCPGASSASFGMTEPLTTAKGDRVGVVGTSSGAKGRQAYGVYAVSAGRMENVKATGFYMEFATD